MALPLRDVRAIAAEHAFEEIDFNEYSRVISFRGGPRNTTRINVYYTTGTVGTCLNHPKSGKTQLFRRNVTLDVLWTIFSNPRVHTGGGYYTRKNMGQQWKDPETNISLADSARRWLYVGEATGLIKTERERNTVAEICTKWDSLIWNPGTAPYTKSTRYDCGSAGGLHQMLFEVVYETYGDFQIYEAEEVNEYHRLLNAGVNVAKPEPNAPPLCGATCDNLHAFMEAHADEVWALKSQFMSLRKEIRTELMAWYLQRRTMDQVFANLDVIPFQSKKHNAVHAAHIDYGKLYYPHKRNICYHCGVTSAP